MIDQTNQTFTSRKLDWLKCVCFDRLVQPYDFKVAFVIGQHINQKTLTACLSDETIADESGGSARNVKRSRVRLREAGYISWRRTRTANVYRLRFEKVSGIFDAIISSRDARKERRKRDGQMGHRWPISRAKMGHRGHNKMGHRWPTNTLEEHLKESEESSEERITDRRIPLMGHGGKKV
jgi:hypothetical protein